MYVSETLRLIQPLSQTINSSNSKNQSHSLPRGPQEVPPLTWPFLNHTNLLLLQGLYLDHFCSRSTLPQILRND